MKIFPNFWSPFYSLCWFSDPQKDKNEVKKEDLVVNLQSA